MKTLHMPSESKGGGPRTRPHTGPRQTERSPQFSNLPVLTPQLTYPDAHHTDRHFYLQLLAETQETRTQTPPSPGGTPDFEPATARELSSHSFHRDAQLHENSPSHPHTAFHKSTGTRECGAQTPPFLGHAPAQSPRLHQITNFPYLITNNPTLTAPSPQSDITRT
jgi:hypothetical protein